MKNLLTLGNRKLPKTTGIFNLPAIETCPGATSACKAYCYARKAERIYRGVLNHRQESLKDSKNKNFVPQMVNEIALLVSKGKINKVRIHESGDFYSQKYINDWQAIAETFPGIIFYAYTRSYQFNFSGLQSLDNVRLIFSLDETSCKQAIKVSKTFVRASKVIGKHEEPKILQNAIVCPGDCKICSICSSNNRYPTILFRKH